MTAVFGDKTVSQWCEQDPTIADMVALREVTWITPPSISAQQAIGQMGLGVDDILDASDRLRRFAPYLQLVFPGTGRTGGILESPLVGIPTMQEVLEERFSTIIPGKLWAKLDSDLPISGSIKARGGIYEVLKHAEELAIGAGILSVDDDYRVLATPKAREFFSGYQVAVGSTGNLGLSIGIISAALGFQASVHMSSDARQWKKDTLRSHGVTVVEYDSDYSVAVAAGREQAEGNDRIYFVDDENSVNLFMGYAVAGVRLAGQLQALSIPVDEDHPLFIYLPCGVGGGPGGVAFGLKAVFGDDVHCLFAEPTHSPCMMLGVRTGLHDGVSVQDFGIDNVTAADGLAVGRPSGFVGRHMYPMLSGYYTIDDDEMYRLLYLLHQTEEIDIEPSAAAGLAGPTRLAGTPGALAALGVDPARAQNATHIAWCTGGSMVPEVEMNAYLRRGDSLVR